MSRTEPNGPAFNADGGPALWQALMAPLELTFEDHFDGETLDPLKWVANWDGAEPEDVTDPANTTDEAAAYDPAQVTLEDSVVTLSAITSAATVGENEYTSRTGMISTKALKEIEPPCAVEFRMWCAPLVLNELVNANWPKAYLYGVNPPQWPDAGEIVMAEGDADGALVTNLHKAADYGTDHDDDPIGEEAAATDSTGWHIFTVVWYPDAIYWAVDGVLVRTYIPTPETNEYIPSDPAFLVFANQVPKAAGTRDALIVLPADVKLDYVRVYTAPA